jgi:hypothetical protein
MRTNHFGRLDNLTARTHRRNTLQRNVCGFRIAVGAPDRWGASKGHGSV